MRYILTRLVSFAGLLAISGAALAGLAPDGAVSIPEPGILELTILAGVIGFLLARNNRK
jgi:hypothetical protein